MLFKNKCQLSKYPYLVYLQYIVLQIYHAKFNIKTTKALKNKQIGETVRKVIS